MATLSDDSTPSNPPDDIDDLLAQHRRRIEQMHGQLQDHLLDLRSKHRHNPDKVREIDAILAGRNLPEITVVENPRRPG